MAMMILELCSTTFMPGTLGLLSFTSLKRKKTSVHESLMIQDDPMIKSFIDKGIL